MAMRLLETPAITVLRRAMDAYALRQRTTASNVANLDTPGYRRLDVQFEEALARARRRYKAGFSLQPPQATQARLEAAYEGPVLEDELMTLADTQMRVAVVVRALQHTFRSLRMAITGRTAG